MASSSDEISAAQTTENKGNFVHEALHPYLESFEESSSGIAVSEVAGTVGLFAKPLPFIGFGFIAKMCRSSIQNFRAMDKLDKRIKINTEKLDELNGAPSSSDNTQLEIQKLEQKVSKDKAISKQNWRNFRWKSAFLFGGLGATTLGCISTVAYCVAVGSALAAGATIGAALAVTLPYWVVPVGIVAVSCSLLMIGASIFTQLNRCYVNYSALKNLNEQNNSLKNELIAQELLKTSNPVKETVTRKIEDLKEMLAKNEILRDAAKKEKWDSTKGLFPTAGMLLATIGVMATPIALIGLVGCLPFYVIYNNRAQSWCNYMESDSEMDYQRHQNILKVLKELESDYYYPNSGLPKANQLKYVTHTTSPVKIEKCRANQKIMLRLKEVKKNANLSTIKNEIVAECQ